MFGRSLFGYKRRAVDQYVGEQEAIQRRYLEEQATHNQYVAEQAAARRALEAEIQSLRAAQPMLKVNHEVSALLTSFASTVSTMREQAEREATHTRTEADGYAEQRRDEAERLFKEQRARGAAVAEETVRAARNEVLALVHNQAVVEQSLRELAQGVYAWITTLEQHKDATQPPVDLGGRAPGAGPGSGPGEGRVASRGAQPEPGTPHPPEPGTPHPPEPGTPHPPEPGTPHPPEPTELDVEHGKIIDFQRPEQPGNGGN